MAGELGTNGPTLGSFKDDFAAAEKRANDHFGIEESEVEDDDEGSDESAEAESETEDSEHDSETPSDSRSDEDDDSDDVEGDENEGEEDHDDEEDTEPAKKATKKAKSKPAEDDSESGEGGRNEPSDDDVAILRAQAKKLGFDLDKGQKRVSIPEREAFRAKMRRDKSAFNNRVHNAQIQLEERGARMEAKFAKSLKLEEAIKVKDYDAMARIMGHKEGYREMNQAFIELAASPDYLKNQAMEAKIAAMEKRELDGREEMGRAAQEREKQANSDAWDEEVRGYLSQDTDETVVELSKEPDFIDYMNTFLKGANGDMSVEEARDLAVAELRKEQTRLNRIFGAPGGSIPSGKDNAETPVDGASVEKKKKRTKRSASKTISHKEATDASHKSSRSTWSEERWNKYWSKKMAQAANSGDR